MDDLDLECLAPYLVHELELRNLAIEELSKRSGLSYSHCLKAFIYGNFSERLRVVLVELLKFDNWEQIQEAAQANVLEAV